MADIKTVLITNVPGMEKRLPPNAIQELIAEAETVVPSKTPTGIPAVDAEANRISDMLTGIIVTLRDLYPHPQINALMSDVYAIVNNQIVVTAVTPAVPSLGLMLYMKRGTQEFGRPILAAPPNFANFAEKNPVFAAGAVVYNGSKVRDYYNGKVSIETIPDIEERALCWEAEYIRSVQTINPTVLNDYQRKVLAKYPNGLDSMPERLKYAPIQRPALRENATRQ